jgi:hypothetical protein
MLLFAMITYVTFLRTSYWKGMLVVGFLALGVLANATGSGVIGLFAVGAFYAASQVRRSPLKALWVTVSAIALLGLIAFIAYSYLLQVAPQLVQKMQMLLLSKGSEVLAISTGNYAGSGGGTFRIRVLEFTGLYKYVETPFDFLFGIGAFYGYIENQYFHVLVVWGAVGLLLFLGTMLETIVVVAAEFRLAAMLYVLAWAIAGVVLITTYLFPVFVPFAIATSALMASSGNSGSIARRGG